MTFRRRFVPSRRGARKGPARRWTGELVQAENVTAAGTLTQSVIVATADYRQSTTLEAGSVTLVRIRGQLTARATVIGAVASFGIWALDESEGATFNVNADAGAAAALFDGTLLWAWHGIVPSPNDVMRLDIDIKSKRRLQGTQIVFTCASRAQATTWVYAARALLVGG